jgi:hypothetical protein
VKGIDVSMPSHVILIVVDVAPMVIASGLTDFKIWKNGLYALLLPLCLQRDHSSFIDSQRSYTWHTDLAFFSLRF